MTNWQDSDELVRVENIRHLEMMKNPSRKDGFERTQRLAQYWKSQVTNYLERYGIEVKTDSIDQQMF